MLVHVPVVQLSVDPSPVLPEMTGATETAGAAMRLAPKKLIGIGFMGVSGYGRAACRAVANNPLAVVFRFWPSEVA